MDDVWFSLKLYRVGATERHMKRWLFEQYSKLPLDTRNEPDTMIQITVLCKLRKVQFHKTERRSNDITMSAVSEEEQYFIVLLDFKRTIILGMCPHGF